MEKIKDLLIIGGDSRQLYMADHLEERGLTLRSTACREGQEVRYGA